MRQLHLDTERSSETQMDDVEIDTGIRAKKTDR